jgi:GTP-binding protein HflX
MGNLKGLAPAELKRLEKLQQRRLPPKRVVSPEFARELTELSAALRRRLGVLIDRAGRVEALAVGDAHRVDVPRKPSAPSGRMRFCTLRFLSTRFEDTPLGDEDLAPLAMHRLDALAGITVGENGLPGNIYLAHLMPDPTSDNYRLFDPRAVGRLDDDFLELIRALEQEFDRHYRRMQVADDRERAILVHVTTGRRSEAEASMDELEELAESSELAIVERIVQRRQKFDPKTLMGAGKLQDLVVHALRLQADYIVVDQNLTPTQGRAIAVATDMKVLDRSQLILDIFAQRARTREGKIQVELAQLKYLLPRLMSRGDSGLSRLAGGIGGRGPGEQKLEIDRRRVRDRIRALERQLATARKQRERRRSRRRDRNVPVISLVGYTNAGKSTLLNVLTQSDVLVEKRMFATLDPTSRRLRLPREREVVINDTVGFIRDLPKDLVEAFQATLEEIEDSDLIVHLVDGRHEGVEQRILAVEGQLSDLGYAEIPRMLVFNKADKIGPDERSDLVSGREAYSISALTKEGFPKFLEAIERHLPVVDEPWRQQLDHNGLVDDEVNDN